MERRLLEQASSGNVSSTNHSDATCKDALLQQNFAYFST